MNDTIEKKIKMTSSNKYLAKNRNLHFSGTPNTFVLSHKMFDILFYYFFFSYSDYSVI